MTVHLAHSVEKTQNSSFIEKVAKMKRGKCQIIICIVLFHIKKLFINLIIVNHT